MDRSKIAKLLARYVESLETAATISPAACDEHLRIARRLNARWLCGEPLDDLQAELHIEWNSYMDRTDLPDSEAFAVGWALGQLCHVVGVRLYPRKPFPKVPSQN